MKTSYAIQFIFWLTIILNFNCKKTTEGVDINDNLENIDADLNRVEAGSDRFVIWPEDNCTLATSTTTVGFGRYAPNGPLLLSWRMISGPGTPQVQTIENGRIEVSQLQLGVYQFEVSFDKIYGNYNKDSVRIMVDDLSSPLKEFIFSDQTWIPEIFGGSRIYLKDIYDKIPPESAFRTLIKNGNNSNWEVVEYFSMNNRYSKSFSYKGGAGSTDKGEISIYSKNEETGKADIKLVF